MKVFITRKIPNAAKEIFKANGIDIKVYSKNNPISKEELIKFGKNADGIISLLTDKIDSEIIDALPKCKIIANYAVGFNNIDIEYAAKKGIVVTNTPGILTDATADLAMSLLLACARYIPHGDKFMREGKFSGWEPELFLGRELRGKTCGVIGFGRIGQAFAERASAFGCKIIYYNRTKKSEVEEKLSAKKVSLKTLMSKSDFISVHLPLNEKTNNLINKEALDLMKTDAIFINTARGEVIDEQYLIKMLKARKVFSAGFDVYEGEPAVNEKLLKLDNVVLAPHTGSATIETRTKMAELAAKNVVNILSGKKALTAVN